MKRILLPLLSFLLLLAPLSFAQDMKNFTFHTDATSGNGTEVDITGLSVIGVSINGSVTSNRVVAFEVADSIGTFSAVKCTDVNTLATVSGGTLSGATPQRFQCFVGGFKKFRVRIAGGSTGTVSAVGLGLAKASRGGGGGGGGGGTGDALTTLPLSQFAPTTSLQLRSTLTDPTGTGSAVFGVSPTITTPIGIVKGDVGLSNVDNTSDATKYSASATLTNKTIDLSSNTLLTTLAQLNIAITDNNVVPETRTLTIGGTSDEITCTGGTQDLSANRTWTCSFAPITDFNGQQVLLTRGTTVPGSCTIGQVFFDTDASSGQNLYGCTAGNTWTLLGDGTGAAGTVTISGTPTTGQSAEWSSSTQITGVNVTGTGDYVKGTAPVLSAPTGLVKGDVGLANVDNTSDVTKNAAAVTITNKTVNLGSNTVTMTLAQLNTAITDANVVPEVRTLTLSGTTDEITCTGGTQDLIANRTWTCSFAPITDFNGQQLMLTRGTTAPGTCTVGQVFFDTDAPSGQNLYGCTITNTWTLLGDGTGAAGTVTVSGTPTTGQIAQWTSATQITGMSVTGTGSVVKGTSPVITTPTGIVKADVGLSNVDNTSDATKNTVAATLTSKTIDFASNTITTTLAQLNTAISDANVVPEVRSLTLSGTTNEITCTGGTQDLIANRTWTCSFATITDFNGQQLLVSRGTALPGTCTIGQIFFDTDATAGQNIFACTATDVWTLVGGTGSGDALTSQPLSQFSATTSAQLAGVITNETGTGALVFSSSPNITSPTGIVKSDVGLGNVDNTSDAAKNTATVTLLNKTIDFGNNTLTATLAQLNAAITDANLVPEVRSLTINGTTDEITCTGGAQDLVANRTWTCSFAAITDFNGQQLLLTRGTTTPGACTTGQIFFDTDAAVGQNLFGCTSTNVWTAIGGAGNALTSQPLSQFAATTSLQLAGVLTNETGTGLVVFGTSPNITTPTGIVKGDVGLANVDNTSDATKNSATATLTNKTLDFANNTFIASSAQLAAALTNETGTGLAVFGTAPNITAPTGIVKGDVGLGNVDNTSDATKNSAVATLTNKTINLTSNTLVTTSAQLATAITDETGTGLAVFGTAPNITAPTGIVKGDIGLANVDNTSDVTKNAAAVTLTNKTINLTSNTLVTTLAQLNTAVSDANVVPEVRSLNVVGTINELECASGSQDLSVNRTWTCALAAIVDFNGQQLLLTRATTLPGTCSIGQIFFDTDAAAGQNLYGCTTTDAWSPIGGAGNALTSSPLSQFAATTSAQLAGVLTNETGTGVAVFGTSPNITTPTGIVKGDVGLSNVDNTSDATKDAAATTLTNKTFNLTSNTFVATLAQLNTAVSDANLVPEARTVAVNGTTDEITCTGGTQDLSANRSWTCSFAAITDFNGQQLLVTRGTTAPGTCTIGQVFFDTDATVGQNFYGCTSTNTWTLMGGTGGGDALTGQPLSQFAATTSAQLAGVLTNETGTGVAVFGTSPNITTPTGIVKGDVGLGNVDNTSDATKNAATVTLTNKTINLTSNTLVTTLAQLNAAISDADVENVVNKSTNTTLGTSDVLYPTQNAVRAYVVAGLSGKQDSLGFTAENVVNKTTSTALGASDTLYPTQKAVRDYVLSTAKAITNTAITPRGGTGTCALANATPLTISADNATGCDFTTVAELSQTTTFSAPSGTHVDGQIISVLIFTTTQRALVFATGANAFSAENGMTLPTWSKTAGYVLFAFRWNAVTSRWAFIATNSETEYGTAGYVRTAGGDGVQSSWAPAAGGVGGTIGDRLLPVTAVRFPATDPATLDLSENNARLLFDNSVRKCAFWGPFRMNPDYSSGLIFKLQYSMTSVTSGGIAIDVEVMAVTPGDATDPNTDSNYASVNTCTDSAVPGTAGNMEEISCTLTNADSLAARDLTKIRLCRNVSHATDTAAGIMEALGAALEYTR